MSYCRACRLVKEGDVDNLKVEIGYCPWCGRDNRVIEDGENIG